MQSWIVAACIIGVVVGALFLAARYDRILRKNLHDLAQANGWTLTKGDSRRLAPTMSDLIDQSCSASYVVEVETGVRNIFFINGSYSHRAGRNKPIFANFCLIQSDNFRKFETRVDVVPRRGPDRLLLGDQVALGSAEFDRNVIVTCEDPAAARNTINPAMQKVLLEQVIQPLVNPAWIVFYKGYAVLILGSYIEPACWLDSVNLAKKLDEAAEE